MSAALSPGALIALLVCMLILIGKQISVLVFVTHACICMIVREMHKWVFYERLVRNMNHKSDYISGITTSFNYCRRSTSNMYSIVGYSKGRVSLQDSPVGANLYPLFRKSYNQPCALMGWPLLEVILKKKNINTRYSSYFFYVPVRYFESAFTRIWLLFKAKRKCCPDLWIISRHFDPENTGSDRMNGSEVDMGGWGGWRVQTGKKAVSALVSLYRRL